MSETNRGRVIRSFMVFHDEAGNPVEYHSGNGYALVFENEFHGDRDEDWIVNREVATGRECERWSAKHAAHIVWTDERFTPTA